jgi:hypothetical protein
MGTVRFISLLARFVGLPGPVQSGLGTFGPANKGIVRFA